MIGRKEEIERLMSYADSNRAEFVAVYGRRRVGKTFLVNKVFEGRLTFEMTGIMSGNKAAQMHAFADALDMYGYRVEHLPKNWYSAFQLLRQFLEVKQKEGNRCIVFIDELPCFDTPRSDFVNALGYFWNSWASRQENMLLIVCGSATSWMMEHVVDNHGGLHDRITHEIHLREFTLLETEKYLESAGFVWDRLLVMQAYMVMGGIPYYLSLLDNTMSLAQNIDRLFFRMDGEMRREYHRLYRTLFKNSDPYLAIIEALFKKKKGLTRDEIAAITGKDANGRLSKMLQNLVDCDIVRFYYVKHKKITSKNGIYQLMDFYSLFFLQFLKEGITDEQFWTKSLGTPLLNTWMGLAFEHVCLAHIRQIKHALGIEGIRTEYYTWRSEAIEKDSSERKAQIDLVVERSDKMVNICEAKYCEEPYLLTKEEYEKFQHRMSLYRQQTAFKGGVIPTFITPYGLHRNPYADYIVRVVRLDDLFA